VGRPVKSIGRGKFLAECRACAFGAQPQDEIVVDYSAAHVPCSMNAIPPSIFR
jgi:hypothetical protein